MRRTRPRDSATGSEGDDGNGSVSPTDRANIPTDLLRTFVAICELGSFTKAAHLFGLTQPAVSAHMRRLETIIGSDLIDKNTSDGKLTVCGNAVLRHARRILASNEQLVASCGHETNLPGTR